MFSGCSENERSLLSLSIPDPGGSIGDQVTLLRARTTAVQPADGSFRLPRSLR